MGTWHTFVVTGVVLLLFKGVAQPQSLADVARKTEEERRKVAKTPSKVYTDENLKRSPGDNPSPVQSTSPQPAAGSQPATAAVPKKEEPADKAKEPVKDQKYWKDRITQANDQLQRSKLLLEGMQTRVNSLTTDIINRDDPGQRAVLQRSLRDALGEVERLKREIQEHTKAVAAIEEEARKANVPPGWLR